MSIFGEIPTFELEETIAGLSGWKSVIRVFGGIGWYHYICRAAWWAMNSLKYDVDEAGDRSEPSNIFFVL